MIDVKYLRLARPLGVLLAGVLALVFNSCGGGDDDGGGKLKVVATTGMVADMVEAIGGDRVEVTQLMGAGIDPHSFKPELKDTIALDRADIIFYSGLLLEGKMEKDWEKHAAKSYALASAIPAERTKGDKAHPDPHVWGDVSLWATCIDGVAKKLAKHDPGGADEFDLGAKAYGEKLEALHVWALAQAKKVPEGSRIMVTSHDAFSNTLARPTVSRSTVCRASRPSIVLEVPIALPWRRSSATAA